LLKNLQRRNEIWRIYNEEFSELPLKTPTTEEKGTVHARHLYTIFLEIKKLNISRDQFINQLIKENIGTGVHYRSLHLHHYYKKKFGFKADDFPNANYISERTVSLPLSPKLSDQDVMDVAYAVKRIILNNKK